MDPLISVREKLAAALGAEDISVQPEDIHIEHTEDFSHGDYASNVALVYAKQLKTNPRELAEKLASAARDVEGIASVEVAGPGFINFMLSPDYLAEMLEIGRKHGDKWGSGVALKGEEVLIEYTSPNLFKPLHIGNLVGNVIGESITRLFEFEGAKVRRINYPSDIGLTVAKGVWGLQKTGGDPDDIKSLGEAYRVGNEAYETDETAKAEINAVNKKLYEGSDKELNRLRTHGIKTSRARLKEICETLGTEFDFEIFESEASPLGTELVKKNVGTIFEVSEGATVYPGEKDGLHTRVFLNSAGLPTYEAKDLGNFALKHNKYSDFQRSYIVTGVEQQEYFKVVIAAIKKVFPDVADRVIAHIATGFLTLTTGKMSSRKGNVLTGEDLLADLKEAAKERAAESRAKDVDKLAEEIAVAALKFQILKGGASKNIVFDRERALSLEGDSGPYLQYTHARCHAIMEKAADAGVKGKFDPSQSASDLARLIYRFYETVVRAQEELEPHIVANYLIAVASAFNSWYAKEQILDGTDTAAHKVALTDITRLTLKNGLWLLGIPAPEKV